VAIARALAAEVKLLLVEGPTGGRAAGDGRAVGPRLAQSASQRGLAVVCATHDPVLIDLAHEVVNLSELVPDSRA
jgi:ABC-type lipoprotein export system ATPase subunit